MHKDIIGGGWLALDAGQVTDDTQISLALGRAIIDNKAWNIEAVAKNFVLWKDSNPPDIGNTCRRGISRYQETGEIFGPVREHDAGNSLHEKSASYTGKLK